MVIWGGYKFILWSEFWYGNHTNDDVTPNTVRHNMLFVMYLLVMGAFMISTQQLFIPPYGDLYRDHSNQSFKWIS